jgi:superfamily II DNA/RNA helicase
MHLKVCGCVNISSSIQKLQDGVQIVVGTPNRLCDLISRRRALKVEAVNLFVLDGFDEMLSRDNRDQIFEILNLLSKDVQRVISSATMPPEVMEVAQELTRDPGRMIFKSTKSPFDRVVQYYIPYESEDDKFVALNDLLSRLPSGPVIIYCNSYGNVDSLAQQMQAKQITVFTLHNQMTHQERNEIVRRHRLGEAGVLIMTDFRAHGFDVRYSSAVINYEMPRDRDYYLHRINIPIEDGKKGLCFSFIQSTEIQFIRDLEEYYQTEIKEVPAGLTAIGLL